MQNKHVLIKRCVSEDTQVIVFCVGKSKVKYYHGYDWYAKKSKSQRLNHDPSINKLFNNLSWSNRYFMSTLNSLRKWRRVFQAVWPVFD
jgi:hypothetical protein